MNKQRRNELDQIRSQLDQVLIDLEAVRDDEENCRDSIPENLHGTERYAISDEACIFLDEAVSELSATIDALDQIIN